MKTKEERRQEFLDKQRLEKYGEYPEWTFFQHVVSLIGYAPGAARIERDKSSEEAVEYFKGKVGINLDGEGTFRSAGISEEKCEARRQFYVDLENCKTVCEMCKVMMDFAMKIVEEKQ
jgi:hypothetical protein